MTETNENTTTKQIELQSNEAVNNESSDNSIHKPEIFNPPELEKYISNLNKIVEDPELKKRKICERAYRLIPITFIPIFLFPVTYKYDKLPLVTVYGIGLLVMFIGYFIHLFIVLCSATKGESSLFRVYSLTSIPKNWTTMGITSRELLIKYESIESISEFSAIGGGIANHMLQAISSYAWAIVLTSFATKLHFFRFTFDIDEIFELIGAFGLTIIGTFELDPYNNILQNIHTTGAILGIGTLIGYIIQQIQMSQLQDYTIARIISPILITTIGIIGLIYWKSSQKCAKKYTDEHPNEYDKKMITKYSFQCIIGEAIFLFSGALSMCLWLIFYSYNCKGTCDTGCRAGAL